MATGVLGKLALDVALLAQSEVGEVREAGGPGRGGSSTLPQKRNPGRRHRRARLRQARARARRGAARGAAAGARARLGGWQIEWEVLPELFRLAGAAAAHMGGALRGLEVDPARMRANLEASGGGLVAERIALALAPALGRAAAQERVEAACRRALERGTPLRDVLAADAEIAARLAPAELEALLDPTGYRARRRSSSSAPSRATAHGGSPV